MKKIIIGSDHAGFAIKEALVPFLKELGYEVKDCGPEKYDPEDDYPDYISPVAHEVSKHISHIGGADTLKGIILGASGQGEAMVANKFPHVRAAVYYGFGLEQGKHDAKKAELEALTSMQIIELSRLHNDANILSLGAKFMDADEAKAAVKLWLETPFSGEARHKRRIEEMEKISTK
ncbi:TPA: ribose-5-phosphate isomerase [Candidatus Taylorbacteria bacterium]|nr:ribose-5-phosphate isomerase [Candidatus Taylorbacteria bacterium]